LAKSRNKAMIIDGHTNQEPIGIDDLRLAHEHDHYGRGLSQTQFGYLASLRLSGFAFKNATRKSQNRYNDRIAITA